MCYNRGFGNWSLFDIRYTRGERFIFPLELEQTDGKMQSGRG